MSTKPILHSPEEYRSTYEKSLHNPELFWAQIAEKDFKWHSKWDKILEHDLENAYVKWFINAKLNITENCIDRHLADRRNQTAIIWEANDPNEVSKHITYGELASEVNRVANMLKSIGVEKGDRVCLYMPMVPELTYAVLACARIGAVHSVVFAGFSSRSLADRINDAACKVLLTADGGFRGDKITHLKDIADEALMDCPTIEKVVVLNRVGNEIKMAENRDVWWSDAIKGCSIECEAEIMDSEDPLFILYTSGSTGKPKGMVHSSGGYMVYTNYTFRTVFQYQEGQVYWCTADIGWITGHSYIIYGPLSAGATTLMYEGTPSYPDLGRMWDIVDKHKVEIFYTAPTAIRALAQCDISLVNKHSLDSLKVLGSVGEPINEEAWNWYNNHIGKGKCPIVDTWWQTETGGIMISPIPGATPFKPTYATYPLPGIQCCLVNKDGEELTETEAEGGLCIKYPWPSMARTIYGDHERYKQTYFSDYPGKYFTGDGCRRDANGQYRITGRMDDVVIVSGHNLGTAEIENALDEHPDVSESAVVGYPHELKGNAIYAFVQSSKTIEDPVAFKKELLDLVSHLVGPIAKPEVIQLVSALPKTRSGKIMRRILRKIAAGERKQFGDISTLLNPEAVQLILDELNQQASN
ncbi:MAG: acetate--CoA ligase [Bacteroidia bacterium]